LPPATTCRALADKGGGSVSYAIAWIPGAAFLWTVLLLLILPSFALIGLIVVALAALAVLVALAGAMLATPYLLVHSLRRTSRSAASQRPSAPPRTAARS
jgi:hypothetical protein